METTVQPPRRGHRLTANLHTVMNGTQPPRQGNRDLREAPQGVFPCAEADEWVALACWSDAQWQGLCAALERPDWAHDPRLD